MGNVATDYQKARALLRLGRDDPGGGRLAMVTAAAKAE